MAGGQFKVLRLRDCFVKMGDLRASRNYVKLSIFKSPAGITIKQTHEAKAKLFISRLMLSAYCYKKHL